MGELVTYRVVAARGQRALAAATVLAICVVGAPADVGAQPILDEAPVGDLEMRGPSKIVLGSDDSAQISLRDPGDVPLRFYVNVGSLSEPASADGELLLTYTPPTTGFPQVAVVVAATDDQSVFDWIQIPLHGQPSIAIETEPRATAIVRVGDDEFGPVKTDRKGRARIALEVPPGVDEVLIVTEDKHGNSRETVRALGVPEVNRLVAVCPRGGDELLLFAVDNRGEPLDDASFALDVAIGALETPQPRARGVYAARFVVGAGEVAGGDAELVATLAGAPASTGTCRASIPAERAERLTLSFDRDTFVAGSGPVSVFVDVAYPGRRLPRPVIVELEASIGVVSNVSAVSETQYTATWQLPDDLGGRTRAELRVASVEPALDADATIELVAGDVASLVVSASRGWVRADGDDTIEVRVEAIDRFGNRSSSADLSARADGRVHQLVRGDGQWVGAYSGPKRYTSGTDSVTVRDGASGAEGLVRIELRPMARRFRASARAGFGTNLGALSSAVVALDVGMRLPFARQRVSVGVESGYYSGSASQERDDGAERVDLSATVVPLIGRAVYDVEGLPFALYGGGGAGVLLASTRIESPSSGMRKVSEPRFVVCGVVGARKKLGPGLAVAEVGYWYSAIDDAGMSGNIGGVRLTGGYGLEF